MKVSVQIVEVQLNSGESFKKYICIDDGESICLITLPGLYQISFMKPLPEDVKVNKITEPVRYVL